MDTGSISPLTASLAASLNEAPNADRRAEHREIIKAVHAVNGSGLLGQRQELQFSLDRETKRPVLKIVDRKTGEVIAQVPPEHLLRLAQKVEKR